jgi:hypothetical protein
MPLLPLGIKREWCVCMEIVSSALITIGIVIRLLRTISHISPNKEVCQNVMQRKIILQSIGQKTFFSYVLLF